MTLQERDVVRENWSDIPGILEEIDGEWGVVQWPNRRKRQRLALLEKTTRYHVSITEPPAFGFKGRFVAVDKVEGRIIAHFLFDEEAQAYVDWKNGQ